MNKLKKTLAGVATLAVSAGVVLAVGSGAANAATPVPYEPDPNAVGTVTLYDSTGAVMTHGNTSDPLFAYAVGSAAIRSTDRSGVIIAAQPNPNANIGLWNQDFISGFTSYPLTGASDPANLKALPATTPVVGGQGAITLQDFINEFPNTAATDTNTAWQNLYELRLYTANSGGTQTSNYDNMDVLVDPTTNTWTQVYPVPTVSTSTTLTSNEPTGATVGDNLTLTATETATDGTHPAGTVQFMDGSTNIGTPVAVSAAGVATVQTSTLAVGTHNLSAVFATTASGYTGSTGTFSQLVSPVAPKTNTALSTDGNNTTAGKDTVLTANVTDQSTSAAVSAGTVSFYDNGSSTPLNSTPVTSTTGTFTFDLTTGFAAGPHSVVAKFTPTDPTAHQASQSNPSTFITQAQQVGSCALSASSCTDTQNIQGTIPVGTLKIFTPYTSTNPLDLGTLALTSDDREFTAAGNFSDINVVDNRSGGLGWTITAQSSNLTDGTGHANGVINSQNVGLTHLNNIPGVGFTGIVTGTDNPAADPAVGPTATGNLGLGGPTAHTVATATVGTGTDDLNGLLTLNAPTSTEAGLFTGTITFTVG